MIRPLFLLLTIFMWPLHAIAEQRTFQERIPAHILNSQSQFFTVTIENNSIGQGTDKNYTSGVRLTTFDMGTTPPDLAYLLEDYIPTFQVNNTTSVFYSIGQNLYTPENIEQKIPDPEDRPYAGYLYGSAGFSSVTDNHIDDIELTLGVVGPWALGKQSQEFIHDSFDLDDPAGWDFQLENEPGFTLSWQRRWPEALRALMRPVYFRAIPHTAITLGNVYSYGGGGLTLQITPQQQRWQAQPVRVRPAIPGNGFFAVPEQTFAWTLFAGTEVRAMARNIFLDGNTFRDSPSVDKRIFVADANIGASLTYGRGQLSYTLNWRSEEFYGQNDPSIFGVVSLGYRF